MSQYTSQYPDVPVDPAIKKHFEEFYKTSDTPGADEKYTNFFTEDAIDYGFEDSKRQTRYEGREEPAIKSLIESLSPIEYLCLAQISVLTWQ